MTLSAPEDPILRNRRRRSVRRWVLLGSLPVVLVALVLVVKLLGMYAFAYQAIGAHVAGDAGGTVRAAQQQEWLNLFDPYKAPYNTGVGLASADALPEARAKFEEALALVHGIEECAVRLNLSLTVERMGDAARDAGDAEGAGRLWVEALAVLIDAPEECRSESADQSSPDPDRSLGEEIDETSERLQDKQGSGRPDRDEAGDRQQDRPTPGQDQIDQLEDRLQQGEQERQENDRDGRDGGGSGTEKPW